MTFTHDRAEDWQFLSAWQPSWVRLMLQGVDLNRIYRAHRTVSTANILLRFWHIDDNNLQAHQRMTENPIAEADRQAEWWAQAIDQIRDVPRTQVYAGAINEPNPHVHGPQIRDYTARWLERLTGYGIRGVGYLFSVGNPPLAGESPYDWPYFAQIESVFQRGSHVLGLHEYMQPEGMYAVWTDQEGRERKDFGYLINRHTHCPMNVPIGIFEWGIDGLLFNRHAHSEYGNSGWRNFPDLWWSARYADELIECVRVADPRVVTICPFITDAPDRKWNSFETLTAHGNMLARKEAYQKPEPLPWPDKPDPPLSPAPTPVTPQPGDLFERCVAFVLRWEGGYANNPNDPGGETNFGISKRSYPHLDIRNLTRQQAVEIYRTDYWLACGADKLPWPLCLAHFDTAVNAGVGRAKTMLRKSDGNFIRYMALLIDWYTRIANFEHFGEAWIRRRADILMEASK